MAEAAVREGALGTSEIVSFPLHEVSPQCFNSDAIGVYTGL